MEFGEFFFKIPREVLHQSAQRLLSTSNKEFHDKGAKRRVRINDTMYYQKHSEGGKGSKAHQIRDFEHRHNPAQEEPSDGISARCAGVDPCRRA